MNLTRDEEITAILSGLEDPPAARRGRPPVAGSASASWTRAGATPGELPDRLDILDIECAAALNRAIAATMPTAENVSPLFKALCMAKAVLFELVGRKRYELFIGL